MFISMPKEFFVPVLFNSEFKLNEETGQMEYDTNARKNIIKNNIANIDVNMVRKLSVSKEGLEEIKKEVENLLDKSFESVNKVVDVLTPEQIKKMNFEQMIEINLNKFKENYKMYIKGIMNSKSNSKESITVQTNYSNGILDEVDDEYIIEVTK